MVYEKPEMIIVNLENDIVCTSGLEALGTGGSDGGSWGEITGGSQQ